MAANEAFSRVRIDGQLGDVGWPLTDGRSVRYEYPLPDGTRADYLLCDRRGQALAVLEAKRASRALGEGETQALAYARALNVPFVFLANGEEVRFRDLDRDAHFRPVATVFGRTSWSGGSPLARSGSLRPRSRSTAASPAATTSAPASRPCAGPSSRGGASSWSRWRPARARPGWPRR